MAVGFSNTNKPLNPRGQDASPKGYNRAELYTGKALDFDGVNDKVDLPTLSFDLYAFSFYYEGEINSGTGQFVFNIKDSSNDGVSIGSVTSLLTGETITIGNNGNYTAITESFDDAIHFIVCTWNATESKYDFYLNAQKLNTTNSGTDAALYSITTAPAIGFRKVFNDMYLNGKVSNVRAFNTALTAAQVADLYNNPEKIVPTGVSNDALKLWLPMQEGAGTTAYDGSGNGNHGTIAGATYTHGIGAPVAQTAVIDWNKGSNLVPDVNNFNSAFEITTTTGLADDPAGRSNAVRFTKTTDTTPRYGFQTCGSAALLGSTDYVISLFYKYDGHAFTSSIEYNNSGHFDLSWACNLNIAASGVTIASVANCTANVVEYLNDWYRVDVELTTGASPSGNPQYLVKMQGDTGTSLLVAYAQLEKASSVGPLVPTFGTAQTSDVLLPAGLTTGRDITGVNLFENVRKQGALNLDGNSWAEVHDNASVDLTTSLSLEVWCYPTEDGTSSGRELIGKYISTSIPYQCWVLQYESGKFGFGVGATDNTWHVLGSTTGKAKENWYHIVATYDGSKRKVYINGVQDASDNYTKTPQTTDENIAIGRWLGQAVGGSNTFFGPIAQPRIYNRALTASEVLRNYNSGKNTYK